MTWELNERYKDTGKARRSIYYTRTTLDADPESRATQMAPLVTLYTAERAANPPSIAILLEELGIGYDVVHKVCIMLHLTSRNHQPSHRHMGMVQMV